MECEYTIQHLKDNDLIIFEAIMGSKAYGTSLPTSDIDIRGVFMQPIEDILQFGYVEQVSDETNDTTYYELKRFLELASSNNPNIIEILFSPEDCVLKETEEWKMIKTHRHLFISKLCKQTFAGYAKTQISKAQGYNKKINWESSEMKRKTVLDFCYVLVDGGSKPFKEWLKHQHEDCVISEQFGQESFGLANIDHAHDIYAMYFLGKCDIPAGLVSDENIANQVQLTSIPKGLLPVVYLSFNKDGYSSHCKKYKEYAEWLLKRNEDRFKMNKSHGKNYDSKNMSHVFRLLRVALEIAKTGSLNVRRSDAEIETLMKIRRGEYEFDDLIRDATNMSEELETAYEKSSFQESVDEMFVSKLLLNVRKKRYDEFRIVKTNI